MEYGIKEIKKKVRGYFEGIYSKEELGKWAKEAYVDLLKGGYIESEKIVLYPFIKTISRFHIEINEIEEQYPCSEDDIKSIYAILNGEKDFAFQVELAIPQQVYTMFGERAYLDISKRKEIAEIREKVSDYLCEENDFCNAYKQIISQLKVKKKETVLDMLEEQIFKISMALFETKENQIYRKEELRLYPQKTDRVCMLDKLIDYLDCYLGKRNFNVLVTYSNGIREILLFV
ncbi:MAG: hypothetical protein HDR00_14275 [Lachnospiraceae bacterium]|nr:hypothetical protein [Lachnospiraceae bacterium]